MNVDNRKQTLEVTYMGLHRIDTKVDEFEHYGKLICRTSDSSEWFNVLVACSNSRRYSSCSSTNRSYASVRAHKLSIHKRSQSRSELTFISNNPESFP